MTVPAVALDINVRAAASAASYKKVELCVRIRDVGKATPHPTGGTTPAALQSGRRVPSAFWQ